MKFAFMHYPWYSANSSQTSDTYMTTVQPGATQSIESCSPSNGVKIVFNGHAHIYQRNNPSAPGMPVTYVTGGGGATLEPVTLCGNHEAYAIGWSPTKLKGYACGAASPPTSASQVFHFLKVTVAGSTVTVAPTDENGNTFDVQTYNFASGVDTVIDSAPEFADQRHDRDVHVPLHGRRRDLRLQPGRGGGHAVHQPGQLLRVWPRARTPSAWRRRRTGSPTRARPPTPGRWTPRHRRPRRT